MPTDPPDGPPRWAADALNVRPDAGPEAAVAAFLTAVAADGFLPPERTVAAVAVLSDTPLPVSADAYDETAALIRPEVDAFAAAFWTLPPAARSDRWTDLDSRCDDPASAVFLAHLRTAVRLPVRPQADGTAQELADLMRELFVLRDRPRAVRRAAWLAGSSLTQNWTAAAKTLERDDPAVAALDPVLVRRLVRPAAGLDRRATPSERKRTAAKVQAQRRRTVRLEPEPVQSSSSWSGGLWPVWVALVVISALVRGMVSLSRTDPPRPTYTPPPVVAPQPFQFDQPPAGAEQQWQKDERLRQAIDKWKRSKEQKNP